MSGNILWKFILSAAIIAWAILNITPLRDRPFDTYIAEQASAHEEEFVGILDRARDRVAEGESPSLLFALRSIGEEDSLDYVRFFPHINVRDIANINRRNDILLRHLLGQSRSNLALGLDLKGGVGFTLKIDEESTDGIDAFEREAQLSKAIEIMSTRLDGFGVAEPVIRPRGDDAIEIQIPGLNTRDDPEIINSLRKPARLEFRRLHPSLRPESTRPTDYPVGYEVLVEEREDARTGDINEVRHFVRQIPEATGEIVARARASQGQTGGFQVNLEMTTAGARVLEEVTRQMVGQPLAIVLDGRLYSAPTVQAVLSSRAQITGRFSQREAIELANVLQNPLAVELRVDEMYEVGPSMASDARESSVKAAQLGAALVIVFMVAFYFLGGIIAVISAIANIVLVLGVLASVGATLTLPGVAALVLTLGMGVDANILILERIREELKAGKRIKNAVSSAFEKVFSTIIDANVTTLITAIILFIFGAGPVKGFGLTLAIGICASVFCALVVTRLMIDFLVHRVNLTKILGVKVLDFGEIPFLNYRKPAFLVSWLIVLVGVITVFLHRDNILGIDFTGGDEMTIAFSERIDSGDIIAAMDGMDLGQVRPLYQTMLGEDREVLRIQTEFEQSRAVLRHLQEVFPSANFQEEGLVVIGASVSGEIQRNAFLSVLFALVGILLYVALRFEVGYGIGAVVATVHDVLITIGIFVLFGGQFSAPMLAAILMIVGYSINDTIVVFDRIREELQLNRGTNLRRIVNQAISRTLPRTLLTSITTLLAAVSLYIFGAGVITDFAFVFVVGIITGTFSSVFIASPVFFWWHKGDRRHVEERELTPKRYEWEASSAAATSKEV
jgi:SecD/SecF fusion protein